MAKVNCKVDKHISNPCGEYLSQISPSCKGSYNPTGPVLVRVLLPVGSFLWAGEGKPIASIVDTAGALLSAARWIFQPYLAKRNRPAHKCPRSSTGRAVINIVSPCAGSSPAGDLLGSKIMKGFLTVRRRTYPGINRTTGPKNGCPAHKCTS